MKKNKNKNYIAFTLTEMTMVLLIMSIIAAVSAPVVKHAVSDVTQASTAETIEAESTWSPLSAVSGVYYSASDSTNGLGMVSIGTVPSGASVNYGTPSMIIQANGSEMNNRSAQIGALSADYQRISLDRYNNIAVGNLHHLNDNTNAYGRVEIGSNIGNKVSSSNNAVVMGYRMMMSDNVQYNNAIALGDYIDDPLVSASGRNFNDSITMGYYAGSLTAGTSTNMNDSINIGYYAANNAYASTFSINIGSNAGTSSRSAYNIAIGKYAGFGGHNKQESYANSYANVYLGNFAGYVKQNVSGFTHDYNYGNVFVGSYAGSLMVDPHASGKNFSGKILRRHNSIAIGPFALTSAKTVDNRESINGLSNMIAIGAYAGHGMIDFYRNDALHDKNHIYIGAYAGADSMPNGSGSVTSDVSFALRTYWTPDSAGEYGSIAIGPFAAYRAGRTKSGAESTALKSTAGSSISIGYYAGSFNTAASNAISIGAFAGSEIRPYSDSNSHVERPNIHIGYYAGYGATALGSIGIGTFACANANASGKMCFGNFPYAMMDGAYRPAGWNGQYRAYFYAGAGVGKESDLILASKYIFSRDGSILQLTSDARSKRNIKLSKYSLKEFRKFNIYNFNLKNDETKEKKIGVIAQEYGKAIPDGLVKSKFYTVDTDWLYYSMITAIKDLDKLIQEFQIKFDEYINNFASTKARIQALEQTVAKERQNNENMKKQLDEINKKLKAKK